MQRFILILFLSFITYIQSCQAAQLKIVTANDLIENFKQRDDEKKILLFFTSWCPYCKSILREILNNQNYKKVVFISLDKEYNQIDAFSKALPKDITIYYMSSIQETLTIFQTFGIQYKNSIPYIAVLDEDNLLIKDDLNSRQLYKYLR